MNKKVVIATVCDNQDPDNLHRVKISFIKNSEVVSDWAFVLTPIAGNNTGIYTLPEIDEQVLAISLDENNSKLCVIGSIWSEKSAPPQTGVNTDADLNRDGNNNLHFIKTKKNNMLILDDTESKETIQLISSDSKSKIILSQADEAIILDSTTDIQITAKNNCTIESEEIDITSSKNISLSSEQLLMKDSKGTSLSTDKDITLKASGISLN